DQRVGADPVCLGELAFAVGRHKEQRSQSHAGLRIIRPFLRQYTTSSSRWLNPRCSKVTMPWVGRDLLSRIATTLVSVRNVSPAKTGRGTFVSSIPRLPTVVPSVVSWTESPMIKPSVKIEFIRGFPNSVPLAYSWSMWTAAGL